MKYFLYDTLEKKAEGWTGSSQRLKEYAHYFNQSVDYKKFGTGFLFSYAP